MLPQTLTVSVRSLISRGLALAIFCISIVGCATTYQSGSGAITGGYWEEPAEGELLKVGFWGNGFLDRNLAEQYMLYRCTELARERNASHFLLYKSLTDAVIDRPSELPNMMMLEHKPSPFGYVIFLEEARPGALSVDDLVSHLEPIVKAEPNTAKKAKR